MVQKLLFLTLISTACAGQALTQISAYTISIAGKEIRVPSYVLAPGQEMEEQFFDHKLDGWFTAHELRAIKGEPLPSITPEMQQAFLDAGWNCPVALIVSFIRKETLDPGLRDLTLAWFLASRVKPKADLAAIKVLLEQLMPDAPHTQPLLNLIVLNRASGITSSFKKTQRDLWAIDYNLTRFRLEDFARLQGPLADPEAQVYAGKKRACIFKTGIAVFRHDTLFYEYTVSQEVNFERSFAVDEDHDWEISAVQPFFAPCPEFTLSPIRLKRLLRDWLKPLR
jgi:hypothetical protein